MKKIYSLLVLLIFGFQTTFAVDCSAYDDWYYDASWSTAYSVGMYMKHGGRLYKLQVHASGGLYEPGTGSGATYWVDQGECDPECTNPTIDASSGASRCGTGTLSISATASSGSIEWYDASSGGSLVGSSSSGAGWTTPSISTTTTYYAEGVDGSCTSASRTAVTATVNANPTVSSSSADSRCGTGTLDISASASAGSIEWYDASSGGSLVGSSSSGATWTTPSISTTTTYYAEAVSGSCSSTSRTAVTATINENPSTATAVDGYRYGTGTVDLGVSGVPGGTTIDWYSVSSGGASLETGSSTYTTATINVTTTYYAETRNTTTGCVSTSRVAVDAIVSGKVKDNNTTDLDIGSSWTSGSTPTSLDTAIWDQTVVGANVTILGSDESYLGVEILNPGGSVTINSGNTLTIGSSGIMMGSATQDFYLNNSIALGANQTWEITTSRLLDVDGIVSGAYSITKAGAGTLELTGANTFTGGVDLNEGTLELADPNAMGTTAGTIYIGSGTTIDNVSGGTLNLDNYNYEIEGNFTFTGTNLMNIGSGNVVLTANSTITMTSSSMIIDGVVSGAFSLDKDGYNHLYLNNSANTFTGKVSIDHTTSSNGAIFYNTIGNVGGGASSLGAPTTVGNGTISIGNGAYGGKLMFTGSSDQSSDRVIDLASTTGEVQLDAGDNANLTFTSDFTATGAGSKTLALRGTTSGNIISGDIVDNSGANTTSLDKRESGTWILSADMSYTGSTTISGGTLQLGNGGTTGSITSSTVSNSGTLAVNRSNAITYSGVISGTGALSKSGAGTLTLSGANTYTGTTTISEGTIELGAADRISNSSELVLGGGTFSTGSGAGNSETLGELTLTDTSVIALGSGDHTLTFANSSGSSWTASKLLTVTGWSGGFDGTAAGSSDPKLFVGSSSGHLTAGQLDMISFLNSGDGEKYLAAQRGDGEVVPSGTLLPVDLIDFKVQWAGEHVSITWATASEINSDYFDVQWSIDGINFYSIGEVSASGNTSYRQDYAYVHENPVSLVNYYRLVQYDLDGKKYRKPILRLSKNQSDNGGVYPNPVGPDGILYFDSEVSEDNGQITVHDMSGRAIYSAVLTVFEGTNQIQVPFYSYPPGQYAIYIVIGDLVYKHIIINN